jgi:methyl-accepting chemotaxis protein
MRLLSDRTVTTQLTIGFGIMIILVLLLTAAGVFMKARLVGSLPDEAVTERQRASINFRGSVHDRAISIRDAVLLDDQTELPAVWAEIDRLTKAYDEANSNLTRLIGKVGGIGGEEAALLATIAETDREGRPLIQRAVNLVNAGQRDEAHALVMGELRPLFTRWLGEINRHIDWAEATNAAAAANARGIADKLHIGMLILGAICLAIGVCTAMLIARSISRPIGRVSGVLRGIADGNLTQPAINSTNVGEIGILSNATDEMGRILREIIGEVSNSVCEVTSGVASITDDADEMSTNVERAADEMHLAAAAVQGMTASLEEVSAKTSDATVKATKSGELAARGREVVAQVIENMRGIEATVSIASDTVDDLGAKSQQIGEIITVINDIADQTNLLALNAAIEAARAGEHGRGFAVVADEVRKLAERTTMATDEIARSIKAIRGEIERAVSQMREGSDRVGQGVEAVSDADSYLERILESAEEVTHMISEVNFATDAQTASATQVSTAVERVSTLGRESATRTRSTAQAAEQLAAKTAILSKLVHRFQI